LGGSSATLEIEIKRKDDFSLDFDPSRPQLQMVQLIEVTKDE